MDSEAVLYTTVNLNSFTDAPSLQPILEQPLEKKSGSLLARADAGLCSRALQLLA